MTFKHVKFQDSVVMRSLERVAKEKGLVKEEDLVKNAALTKKADITPTNNLLENLIRLGAGLREAGFTTYADEVEERALAYKQAQSLYEAHKEKGEDLVDAAHPDGSHKMEDVDGDAVFRTILDKQVEMMKVVDKKPTGKLASSSSILNAVKNVLAQDAKTPDVNVPFSPNLINGIFNITRQLSELFNSMQFFSWEKETVLSFNRLNDFINRTAASKMINMGSVDRIIALNEVFKTSLAKETVLGMQSTAAKNAAYYAASLQNFMEDTVKEEVKSLMASAPKTDGNAQKFSSQVDSYLATLKNWTVAINNDPENSPSDKKQANDWIVARTNELNELKRQFKADEAEGFLVALSKSKFVRESAQFKKVWIG